MSHFNNSPFFEEQFLLGKNFGKYITGNDLCFQLVACLANWPMTLLHFFFGGGSCQNPLINAQLSSLVSNSEMISLFSVVHAITVNHKTSTSRLSLNHV